MIELCIFKSVWSVNLLKNMYHIVILLGTQKETFSRMFMLPFFHTININSDFFKWLFLLWCQESLQSIQVGKPSQKLLNYTFSITATVSLSQYLMMNIPAHPMILCDTSPCQRIKQSTVYKITPFQNPSLIIFRLQSQRWNHPATDVYFR